MGVGRSRQLKKKRQAHDLFFSSISLVTGSPRILCTRRLEGGGRVDFTPREMSGGSLKNPKTKYAKPPVKKHTTFSHLGGLEGTGWSRGLKRENVYKVEQDVGRVGGKTVSTSYIPFFSLLNPAGLPFLFFCQKKNRISFNPQKGLVRLLQSCVSGCFRVSGLSSCAPGGPGPRRGLPPRWGSRDRRCCGGGCAPGGCQRGGGRRGGGLRRVASSRPRGHRRQAS